MIYTIDHYSVILKEILSLRILHYRYAICWPLNKMTDWLPYYLASKLHVCIQNLPGHIAPFALDILYLSLFCA